LRRRISSPKRRWSGQLGDIGAEFESVDCRSTLTLAGFRPTPEWQQFSIFSLVAIVLKVKGNKENLLYPK
jgi:hypothetical protein